MYYLKRQIFEECSRYKFLKNKRRYFRLFHAKYSSPFTAEQMETRDAVCVHEDHAVLVHARLQPWQRSRALRVT